MQNKTRQQRRAEQRANTKNSPWRGILSKAQAAAAKASGSEAPTVGAALDYASGPSRRGGLARAIALAAIVGGSLKA
jgi:hypothetical protein